MDIRYFAFLERLKRGYDDEDTYASVVKGDHTRLLTAESGVQIPPGAPEICETLPPVDIPEIIRLFNRLVLKDEMREYNRREKEWLMRAEMQLVQHPQQLHDALEVGEILTEKGKI